MKRPDLPIPHEPIEPICTNPAYYKLFATYEERQAYLMRIEQERNEARYRRLIEDLDWLQDNETNN